MTLGTVVVTGANGQVGRQLLQSLSNCTQRIIALVRTPAPLKATTVITDWMHCELGSQAIAEADAIVHLAGSLLPARRDYQGANLATTQVLVKALQGKKKPIVFLSYVGASVQATNVYLSTKAQVESRLAEIGAPVTVFRCTHIIGTPENPGLTAQHWLSHGGKPVNVFGSGEQKLAIYGGDVVSAIIQALENPQAGIFDLAGPECLSLNDWVRFFNHSQTIKINHLSPPIARLLPWVLPNLPRALVEVMLGDSIGNAQPAVKLWGLKLTPLSQIWG